MSWNRGSDAGLRWSGWPWENQTAPAARIEAVWAEEPGTVPAPEIGRALDPRIGREDRLPVVDDERGVADRLEAKVDRPVHGSTVGF